MPRILLAAVVALLLAPLGSAEASKASATTDKFVGWSEDGRTYAVIRDSSDSGEALLVIRDGRVVLKLCEASESGGGDACKSGEGVKTVSHDMTRINVKRHKHLQEFNLRRDLRKWRKAFRESFMLRGITPAASRKGKPCKRGWRLLRRGDKTPHATENMNSGCLDYNAGYLHTSGKYVLVKQVHSTWSSDEADASSGSDNETTYKFIKLKVRVLPSPEETD